MRLKSLQYNRETCNCHVILQKYIFLSILLYKCTISQFISFHIFLNYYFEMEISMVGQSKMALKECLAIRGFSSSNLNSRGGFLFFKNNKNRICYDGNNQQRLFSVVSSISTNELGRKAISSSGITKEQNKVQLFVGLPLDTLSGCNAIRHSKAIAAGLKAVKLLGLEGVELSIYWGQVEKEGMGKYEWSGYLALVKMVKDLGLKLRVSLCFHASENLAIDLPQWVSQIGETQPDIFFTDRSGKRYRECLSLSVDELPVLNGSTPMQIYKNFLESFKYSFSSFIGSTIMDVSVGLGPNGELRYPSSRDASGATSGIGEFQCYDEHMLNHLKQHAQLNGKSDWGFGGPHDASSYLESPHHNTFFKDNGGSWQSPYGDFFLSWYTGELIFHGERIISLASSIFKDSSITLSSKIPLVHSWYKTRSHPGEMTAGFYNANNKDSYDVIAEMFARNSCRMVLPGMDLSDENQPEGSLCSPELLLLQILKACRHHGVEICGENMSMFGTAGVFDRIKQNISQKNVMVKSFTYQRMGANFFSPEHFPSFTAFSRTLNQSAVHPDDIVTSEKGVPLISLHQGLIPEHNLQMQEA